MTRKEEIRDKANGYAFDLDEGDYNTNRDTFIDGAEWADKTMIEKACEWLRTNYEDIGIRYIRGHKVEDEIESFKKAMEE